MPWNNSAKSDGLGAVRAVQSHLSLHTAYPGDAGANEVAGGSPAYARKAAAWS